MTPRQITKNSPERCEGLCLAAAADEARIRPYALVVAPNWETFRRRGGPRRRNCCSVSYP
jgi:hypothetical protein